MQKIEFTAIYSTITLTIMFAAIAICNSGCGTESVPTGSAVEADAALSTELAPDVLTPEPIGVTAGESFNISLESNPTTGYMWEPEFDTEFLKLVDRKYVADSTLIGFPGVETLVFEALKAGESEIKLVYKRSWENGYISDQSRLVNIAPANVEDMMKKMGETFSISLKSNPTTGYRWQPEFNSEFLELVSSEFTPDSALIGAPGVETLEFRALKQGETEITVIYKRPWGKEHLDKQIIPITIAP